MADLIYGPKRKGPFSDEEDFADIWSIFSGTIRSVRSKGCCRKGYQDVCERCVLRQGERKMVERPRFFTALKAASSIMTTLEDNALGDSVDIY